MIRRPPRSTLSSSSAASDVYKRQEYGVIRWWRTLATIVRSRVMAAAEGCAKLHGYRFWESIGSPSKVVAPMVDQSELAYRMLTRQHRADLCYTPMYNSKVFVQTKSTGDFTTAPEDRPLFVQFCGNDPETLLAAAQMVEGQCDAIDLNLGCPQGIARTGHYGSFLLEEPELLERIVSLLHDKLTVPVTVKIRLLPSLKATISLAKRLEAAGASIITIHGRTKEEKKLAVGLTDWDAIKAIKAEMKIPVFLNGGIADYHDYERAMHETGVDGVMTSEGILENPGLFSKNTDPETGEYCGLVQLTRAYLDLCYRYDTGDEKSRQLKFARAHLFKFLYCGLIKDQTVMQALSVANSFEEMEKLFEELVKTGVEEPWFHASSHPSLGKEFDLKRTWYTRHVKGPWTPSAVTGELTDLLGHEKWGDRADFVKKPKRQATVAIAAECNQCGVEFPSRSKMFKHIREAH
eukprot:TRINITY_DN4260_c0_g2_i2.p1 TRINITY_DN4260_c0_g2~~TRINITY_DN4260_c0_g2_i2.p1  ORF type:complete len:463 (-),score=96.96 TRINITY_DN4260_c0_g2_i2:312-1700(-)